MMLWRRGIGNGAVCRGGEANGEGGGEHGREEE